MARFWMHNGMVQLGDEEMSKSQGIFVTSREAVETYSSDALRLFFLQLALPQSAEVHRRERRVAGARRRAAAPGGLS